MAKAYKKIEVVGVSENSMTEAVDVIDPAESRRWISTALASAPPPPERTGSTTRSCSAGKPSSCAAPSCASSVATARS